MALQVTIPHSMAVEVERIMAGYHLTLDQVITRAIFLLSMADAEQLYTPDPPEKPTRLVRIDVPTLTDWTEPGHWPSQKRP